MIALSYGTAVLIFGVLALAAVLFWMGVGRR